MSFRFNAEVFEDNSFNEKIREKLTRALNSSSRSSPVVTRSDARDSAAKNVRAAPVPLGTTTVAQHEAGQGAGSSRTTTSTTTMSTNTGSTMSSKKLDILKSEIIVSKVNFPTMPKLEILDLDVSAQPRSLVKGICKISCKDAMLQIQTEIESNLLLVYSDYSPDFTTPSMICKDSFTIPITMVFSEIHLEAITNIFVKNSGIGISFNDVTLDFKFDCSIKILQSTIEKRLKKSMQLLFKEVLPSVIFNMSQSLFTADDSTKNVNQLNDGIESTKNGTETALLSKVMLEESDLQELSAANMLRLSTLISSRQTLSLNAVVLNVPSTIPGCLERQNLHRFNSRIPSLSNHYANFRDTEEQPTQIKRSLSSFMLNNNLQGGNRNILPAKVLEKNAYDLHSIANIQTRIFERSTDENVRPRRRKIKMRNSKQNNANKTAKVETESTEELSSTTTLASEEDQVHEAAPSSIINDYRPPLTAPRPIDPVKTFSLINESRKIEVDEQCYSPLNSPTIANLKLPVHVRPKCFTQSDKALLTFDPQTVSRTISPRKLNLLEETNYFNYKTELHKLRSSISSPLRMNNTIFTSGKELSEQRQLLENRKMNFVGINRRGISCGGDDEPPPYIS